MVLIYLIFDIAAISLYDGFASFWHQTDKVTTCFPFFTEGSIQLIQSSYLGSALCDTLTQNAPYMFYGIQVRVLWWPVV